MNNHIGFRNVIAGLAGIAALATGLLIPGGAAAQEVRLRAGDKVTMKIAGVPATDVQTLSGLYTISGEGTLRMPYLQNEIRAASLAPTQVARIIEKRYVAEEIFTRPTVTITMDTSEGLRLVTVAGEVKSPGDVPYRPDLTLLMAVTARGGFSEFASQRGVRLIRGSKVTHHDMRSFSRKPELDIKLKPGDRVIVMQRGLFRGARG